MDLPVTLTVIAATLAVGVFAGWRGALPWNPASGGVRMMPWRFIMVMSGAALFLLLVHLGALLGAPTAPVFPGA